MVGKVGACPVLSIVGTHDTTDTAGNLTCGRHADNQDFEYLEISNTWWSRCVAHVLFPGVTSRPVIAGVVRVQLELASNTHAAVQEDSDT